MQPSVENFVKIEAALQEISGMESSDEQRRLQRLLVLWQDLVKTGNQLLSEEEDEGAPFIHKNSLRNFLRIVEEIIKDKDYKELLYVAMDGEDNAKKIFDRLKVINDRRINNLFLYQQRLVVIETETAKDPIHYIDPKKILVTFSRGEPKEGPAKVFYERILICKKNDLQQPVVIKPEYVSSSGSDQRLETLEKWYCRLLEAIYNKDYLGNIRFTPSEIKAQVAFLFGYDVKKKVVEKNEMIGEIAHFDCELVPDYERMHAEVMPELPCFHVLQALSNSSAASAFFAAMCAWPRLFNFGTADTPFKDYLLKTSPSRNKLSTAEICIENQMHAVISLRRLYDFVLKLPSTENSQKNPPQQSQSNEICLGSFWMDPAVPPFGKIPILHGKFK